MDELKLRAHLHAMLELTLEIAEMVEKEHPVHALNSATPFIRQARTVNELAIAAALKEKRETPAIRMHALVTGQGTAASETALCSTHDTPQKRAEVERAVPGGSDILLGSWQDCTGNEELSCVAE